MSIRLRAASAWMPRFLMAREVDRIRARTNEALDALLSRNRLEVPKDEGGGANLEERRKAMALDHRRRVEALVDGLGHERAVELGRETLYRTGQELGRDARARLGVKDSKDDLLLAALVLYRILGIEFTVSGEVLEVRRCALSEHYSPDTCLVLSAVDEGVVSGLSPRARMRFEKRLVDEYPMCVARISLEEA